MLISVLKFINILPPNDITNSILKIYPFCVKNFIDILPPNHITYMAANQPVSLSSAFNKLVRVLMTSSEWRLLRILVWPSGFVARQLKAKHAFLLAPVSSQHNIFAKADICERKFKGSNKNIEIDDV